MPSIELCPSQTHAHTKMSMNTHPRPSLEGCVWDFSLSDWRHSAQWALKTHGYSLAMDSNESLHRGKLVGPAHPCAFQVPQCGIQALLICVLGGESFLFHCLLSPSASVLGFLLISLIFIASTNASLTRRPEFTEFTFILCRGLSQLYLSISRLH